MKRQEKSLEIRVTIYSDGRVESLSNEGVVIDEFSGKLDILHSVLFQLERNRDMSSSIPHPLNFKSINVYFQTSGTENYVSVPSSHLTSFIKYVIGNDVVPNSIEVLQFIDNDTNPVTSE